MSDIANIAEKGVPALASASVAAPASASAPATAPVPASASAPASAPASPAARSLLGAPVAKALCSRLAPRVEALVSAHVIPKLAVVRVGESAGAVAYERGARSRMEKVGVAFEAHVLAADASQEELEALLRTLAASPDVHGILLMRPLPEHLDEPAVVSCVPAEKDVDGMTAGSLARVFAGAGEGFAPCTPEAVMALLAHYEVPLSGARAVVLGRSLVVGRPLAQLLLAANATVTVCHSRTANLAEECRRADVLVSCMGRAGSVTADMVRPGTVVVDVSTNADGAGGITGDVDFDAVSHVASAVTPVPRGVGSVTTSVLAAHVVEAAERAAGLA